MNKLINSLLGRVLALTLLASMLVTACGAAPVPVVPVVVENTAVSNPPTQIVPTNAPPTEVPTNTPTPIPTIPPSPTPADPPLQWSDGRYATLVDILTSDALEGYGYSTWADLVNGLVMSNPNYNAQYHSLFVYPELPNASATTQGVVLDVVRSPAPASWTEKGISNIYLLVMALPYSQEAGLVLAGLDQDGVYRKIAPYFEGPNVWDNGADDQPLPTAESLVALKGQFINLRLVNYVSNTRTAMDKWNALSDPKNANDPQTAGNYANQILRRGDDLAIFQWIVLDSNGPVYTSFITLADNWDEMTAIFGKDVDKIAAEHIWAFDLVQAETPFIIPEVIGHYQADLQSR